MASIKKLITHRTDNVDKIINFISDRFDTVLDF